MDTIKDFCLLGLCPFFLCVAISCNMLGDWNRTQQIHELQKEVEALKAANAAQVTTNAADRATSQVALAK